MLINTWQELEYRLDLFRATRVAHIVVYGSTLLEIRGGNAFTA